MEQCPENDERLIVLRRLLHIKQPDEDYAKRAEVSKMPIYAFFDETLEPVETKNDFSEVYGYAIEHGCTLRMAGREIHCSLGKLNNFLRCKKPMVERVVMFYGGQRIVGHNQLAVVNIARKHGFHGTMSKAIKKYGLHKEITFAPVRFNCLEVCK